MKIEIELPYDEETARTLLGKMHPHRRHLPLKDILEKHLIEALSLMESGTRYVKYRTQIEKTGWAVQMEQLVDVWKLRRGTSRLLFFPKQIRLSDRYSQKDIYGIDEVISYLETLIPRESLEAALCETCKHFKKPEGMDRLCHKGVKLVRNRGRYVRRCELYSPVS